jgi:hypothetical protein
MSETTFGGLFIIGLGVWTLVLGRLLHGFLERGYERNHPDGDVDRYMRGQTCYKRAFAVFFFVVGFALTAYGLLGGRLPGT